MHEAKQVASCAVFGGRVVVSGGYNDQMLRSVHAYDHLDDSWSVMPNMIERRCRHNSVAVKNKLYAIGGSLSPNCEVFDSTSNKFVLQSPWRDFLSILVELFRLEVN